MSKVSVQIVTWNSKRYIENCLDSVLAQDFPDFSVMVIDNGSNDGTVELLRSTYPTVSVLQNFKNQGFAKANNQGIHLASGEYVLVLNPDVILEPDFLTNMIKTADSHPEAGSFSPKVYKLFSEAIDDQDQSGLREAVKSDIFDSTGLVIKKSRQAFNRGEGQKDRDLYTREEEVFGASGAAVLYRKKALEETSIRKEFFDQDFFAYKEDVDLAWRLQLYGFTCWYVPSAVCYHHRGFAAPQGSDRKVASHRKNISKVLRSFSFRNHHLMLVKNEHVLNIILTLPFFLAREMKIIFYALIFEPFQYKSMGSFFRLLPGALIKRRVIKAHRRVQPRDIRKWFI